LFSELHISSIVVRRFVGYMNEPFNSITLESMMMANSTTKLTVTTGLLFDRYANASDDKSYRIKLDQGQCTVLLV